MMRLPSGGCAEAIPWLNVSEDVLQGGSVSDGINPHFLIIWALVEAGHFLHSTFESVFAYRYSGSDSGAGLNPE